MTSYEKKKDCLFACIVTNVIINQRFYCGRSWRVEFNGRSFSGG